MSAQISIQRDVLRGNGEWAERNRSFLNERGMYVMNLMSSPGAGKTSLLEQLIPKLRAHIKVGVIEGDLCTTIDAERIANLGIQAVQINTDGACHLDARMVHDALQNFKAHRVDLLFIENVGNLVCPADFDLGEHQRIAMLSVTEGADKVEKYPNVFTYADALIISKIDLLPFVNFDEQYYETEARRLNPDASHFRVSAVTGEGIDKWMRWILGIVREFKNEHESNSM
ncbi:hydrogenase nickel incorporation protein HypB [Paenibacillus chungangensis]|uniref:Hydrogenase nickel incorporation protein HypB n=1 Tax=Paenibacillus chungangensis TaxID=696535 RepID=A0ABW3HNE7_9BACL